MNNSFMKLVVHLDEVCLCPCVYLSISKLQCLVAVLQNIYIEIRSTETKPNKSSGIGKYTHFGNAIIRLTSTSSLNNTIESVAHYNCYALFCAIKKPTMNVVFINEKKKIKLCVFGLFCFFFCV